MGPTVKGSLLGYQVSAVIILNSMVKELGSLNFLQLQTSER